MSWVRFILVEFLVAGCVFRFEKIYVTRNMDTALSAFETHLYKIDVVLLN